jgi:hypothetical protein
MDAMNRLDAEALMQMVDDRSVFEPRRSATEGAFIGREGMRRFLADTIDAFTLFKANKDYGDARLALEAAGLPA